MESIKKELCDIEDSGWGGIVRCVAVPLSDSWPYYRGTCVPWPNPLSTECSVVAEYANGKKADLFARGFEILDGLGFRGAEIVGTDSNGKNIYKKDYLRHGVLPYEPRFGTTQLLGTVVKALVTFTCIPVGVVKLLPEDEAERVLRENNVKVLPADSDDEWRSETESGWLEKWRKEGLIHVDKNKPDDPGFESESIFVEQISRRAILEAKGAPVRLCCPPYLKFGKECTDSELNYLADPNDPDYPPITDLELAESGLLAW